MTNTGATRLEMHLDTKTQLPIATIENPIAAANTAANPSASPNAAAPQPPATEQDDQQQIFEFRQFFQHYVDPFFVPLSAAQLPRIGIRLEEQTLEHHETDQHDNDTLSNQRIKQESCKSSTANTSSTTLRKLDLLSQQQRALPFTCRRALSPQQLANNAWSQEDQRQQFTLPDLNSLQPTSDSQAIDTSIATNHLLRPLHCTDLDPSLMLPPALASHHHNAADAMSDDNASTSRHSASVEQQIIQEMPQLQDQLLMQYQLAQCSFTSQQVRMLLNLVQQAQIDDADASAESESQSNRNSSPSEVAAASGSFARCHHTKSTSQCLALMQNSVTETNSASTSKSSKHHHHSNSEVAHHPNAVIAHWMLQKSKSRQSSLVSELSNQSATDQLQQQQQQQQQHQPNASLFKLSLLSVCGVDSQSNLQQDELATCVGRCWPHAQAADALHREIVAQQAHAASDAEFPEKFTTPAQALTQTPDDVLSSALQAQQGNDSLRYAEDVPLLSLNYPTEIKAEHKSGNQANAGSSSASATASAASATPVTLAMPKKCIPTLEGRLHQHLLHCNAALAPLRDEVASEVVLLQSALYTQMRHNAQTRQSVASRLGVQHMAHYKQQQDAAAQHYAELYTHTVAWRRLCLQLCSGLRDAPLPPALLSHHRVRFNYDVTPHLASRSLDELDDELLCESAERDSYFTCCICQSFEISDSPAYDDAIVFCDSCNAGFHKSCYGIASSAVHEDADWFCDYCLHRQAMSVKLQQQTQLQSQSQASHHSHHSHHPHHHHSQQTLQSASKSGVESRSSHKRKKSIAEENHEPDLSGAASQHYVCALCPLSGGALKKYERATDTKPLHQHQHKHHHHRKNSIDSTSNATATGTEWVHVLCALFSPHVSIRNTPEMTRITGIESALAASAALTLPPVNTASVKSRHAASSSSSAATPACCVLCTKSYGALERCCAPGCTRLQHAMCAWLTGCYVKASQHMTSAQSVKQESKEETNASHTSSASSARLELSLAMYCAEHTPLSTVAEHCSAQQLEAVERALQQHNNVSLLTLSRLNAPNNTVKSQHSRLDEFTLSALSHVQFRLAIRQSQQREVRLRARQSYMSHANNSGYAQGESRRRHHDTARQKQRALREDQYAPGRCCVCFQTDEEMKQFAKYIEDRKAERKLKMRLRRLEQKRLAEGHTDLSSDEVAQLMPVTQKRTVADVLAQDQDEDSSAEQTRSANSKKAKNAAPSPADSPSAPVTASHSAPAPHNLLLRCDECSIQVHQRCYGVQDTDIATLIRRRTRQQVRLRQQTSDTIRQRRMMRQEDLMTQARDAMQQIEAPHQEDSSDDELQQPTPQDPSTSNAEHGTQQQAPAQHKANSKSTAWLCKRCRVSTTAEVSCALCPRKGGAFQRTADQQHWLHTVCTRFYPELSYSDPLRLDGVIGLDQMPRQLFKVRCAVCHQSNCGACVDCSEDCSSAAHPLCGYFAGLHQPVYVIQHKQSKAIHAPAQFDQEGNAVASKPSVRPVIDESFASLAFCKNHTPLHLLRGLAQPIPMAVTVACRLQRQLHSARELMHRVQLREDIKAELLLAETQTRQLELAVLREECAKLKSQMETQQQQQVQQQQQQHQTESQFLQDNSADRETTKQAIGSARVTRRRMSLHANANNAAALDLASSHKKDQTNTAAETIQHNASATATAPAEAAAATASATNAIAPPDAQSATNPHTATSLGLIQSLASKGQTQMPQSILEPIERPLKQRRTKRSQPEAIGQASAHSTSNSTSLSQLHHLANHSIPETLHPLTLASSQRSTRRSSCATLPLAVQPSRTVVAQQQQQQQQQQHCEVSSSSDDSMRNSHLSHSVRKLVNGSAHTLSAAPPPLSSLALLPKPPDIAFKDQQEKSHHLSASSQSQSHSHPVSNSSKSSSHPITPSASASASVPRVTRAQLSRLDTALSSSASASVRSSSKRKRTHSRPS